MPTLSAALAIALEHHQAGRLDLAQEIYRRILQAEPRHADALHLLGLVAHALGQHEAAAIQIREAIAIQPDVAAYHNNLGEVCRAMQRFSEAIACCRRAIELEPDCVEAHNNLGIALQSQGAVREAIDSFRRALELKPDYAETYNNLGNTLREAGEPGEAIACFHRALKLDPDSPAALNNLGAALQGQGRMDEALACLRRAVQLRPDFAEAYVNLGNALQAQSKLDAALDCFQRAFELQPGQATICSNLGTVFQDLGRLEEAIACYRRAVELAPQDADACNNLGAALQGWGKLDEAATCCRRAIERKPDFAEAHSNLLLTLEYGGASAAVLADAYAEYDRRLVAPWANAARPHPNRPDPARTLRLGFVSADFRRHPVGYFYLRALEGLPSEDWQIACYSTRTRNDDFTARFHAAAHLWRDVPGISDHALAEQIRADSIDMLFDVAGHAAGNRLLVFARRPAPIQVAWAGPTGLSAMDYLLTDRHLLPPGEESPCRETVLRLPDAYACYEPPADAPSEARTPPPQPGHVTFGSLNNLAKITPAVVRLWVQILRRLPNARLVVRYGGIAVCAEARSRLTDGFADAGIDASRIEIVGAASYQNRLDLYREIDVALDPFPFSGCTTTCESIWMGVPVITVPGPTYFSRQSTSILRNVGCDEFVASDPADYVDRAVAMAEDLPCLAALRAGLRSRMAASPLCDGPRFAKNLAAVLRNVWRDWCAR